MTTENKVTEDSIKARVESVSCIRVEETTLTICIIKMVNGFTVVGESACADPANFDAQIGAELAHANAFEKLWQLEGYLLKERMHNQKEQA
jgi:hypothetical protein